MTKIIIRVLSVVVFVVGIFVLYFSGPAKQVVPVVDKAEKQTNNFQQWETKTDEQASVTVVITPLDLSPQSAVWKFDIGMNTHSVELDQDMTEVAVLVDDKGKEYRPLNWDGPIGGHHREGVLIFNQITPIPKSVELKISDVGSVIRSFIWQFK